MSLQVLEISEKFSMVAATHSIATDYGKLDCITAIFMSFFSRNQPLEFWKALFPVFNSVFDLHGTTLIARENDRFLKQAAFHLLRLAVFRNDSIRKRAVVGIQILVRVGYCFIYNLRNNNIFFILTVDSISKKCLSYCQFIGELLNQEQMMKMSMHSVHMKKQNDFILFMK